MAHSFSRKSTIDRTFTQLAFHVLESAAPGVGAMLAERVWFRLPEGAGRLALAAESSSIRELLGSPFEVGLRGRVVRGWSWGDPSGQPVVYLVHGWAGRAEQLTPLVEPLLRQGLSVVAFDGLSHGDSDAGCRGRRSSDAVELGRGLDAVAARFGPARAIVAHSLAALSTVLALREGWVSAERLVLVAPVEGVPDFMRRFRSELGFGPRTEQRLAVRVERRTGYPVDGLDVDAIAGQLDRRPDLLVVHDLGDRETAHAPSARLVASWPGAELYSTVGLGHRRILADTAVGGAIARFAARLPVESSLHDSDQPQPLPAIALARTRVA